MCIIAICIKRKLTKDELDECWYYNRDGAGVAFPISSNEHRMERGFMQKRDLVAYYDTVDVLPHVVHFRVASSGGVRPGLTHPFICTEDSPLLLQYAGRDMLLFHNGVAVQWEALAKEHGVPTCGPWSDTRALSAIIGRGMEPAELLPTAGGKFVTMQGNAIWRYGEFIEEDGVLFSNSSYKRTAWFSSGSRNMAECQSCGIDFYPAYGDTECYTCRAEAKAKYECAICGTKKPWCRIEESYWCKKCREVTDSRPAAAATPTARSKQEYECEECGTPYTGYIRHPEHTYIECSKCRKLTRKRRKLSDSTGSRPEDTMAAHTSTGDGSAGTPSGAARKHGDAERLESGRPSSCTELQCELWRSPGICRNCPLSVTH